MKNGNSNTKDRDWSTVLTGEMLICETIGKLFYRLPEQEFIQNLVGEDVFGELPIGEEEPDVARGSELLRTWSRAYRDGVPGQDFDSLRTDYTHLFIGLGTVLAPPWESTYFNNERLLFQVQTLQVREWYRKFGLQAEKLHSEPDDHIGLELAFIAYLSGLALRALQEEDEASFNRFLDAQRHFIRTHPLKWAPNFCDQVEQHARTDFYRGLALLTRGIFNELASIHNIDVSDRKEIAR